MILTRPADPHTHSSRGCGYTARSRWHRMGLSDDVLERCLDPLPEVLADGPRTRAEVRAVFEADGVASAFTEALARLARRYFTAFSPATVADFGAWSGLPRASRRLTVTPFAPFAKRISQGIEREAADLARFVGAGVSVTIGAEVRPSSGRA